MNNLFLYAQEYQSWTIYNDEFLNDPRTICIDGEKVYIGTCEKGFSILSDNVWMTYRQPLTFFSNSVVDIKQESRNKLWLATNVGLVLRKNGLFTHYTTENGLPSDLIKKICVENENNIWIGTLDSGAAYFNGSFWKAYDESNSKLYNDIWDIDKDLDGNIWFASRKYDNALQKHISNICKYDGQILDSMKSISYGIIKSIVVDNLNNLWFGITWNGITHNNILKYDISSKEWESISIYNEAIDPDYGQYSSGLTKDNEGNIWVYGSLIGGASKFDGQNWIHYGPDDGFPESQIWNMAQDNKGNYWFLSDKDGIFKWNKFPDNIRKPDYFEDIIIYPNPFSEEISLTFNTVMHNKIHIEIYDIQGKQLALIQKASSRELSLSKTEMNIQKEGVYFIKITSNNETMTQKLNFINPK